MSAETSPSRAGAPAAGSAAAGPAAAGEGKRVPSLVGRIGSVITMMLAFWVAVAGILVAVLVANSLSSGASEKNGILAASIAHELDTLVSRYGAVLGIFERPEALDPGFARKVLELYPLFRGIEVLDRAGRVRFSSAGTEPVGYDRSHRDYFSVPMATGRLFVSSVYVTELSYEPAITISVPVKGGVASGVFRLSGLSGYVRGLARDERDVIAVSDASGAFVAHVDPDAVERRDLTPIRVEGTVVAPRGFGEGAALVSTRSMRTCAWNVHVAQSIDDVYSPVVYVSLALVSILVLSALSAFLLLRVALLVVRRDLHGLMVWTDSVASGDYSTISRAPAYREFGSLARNFGRMAEAVAEREASLKAGVAEKTVLLKEVHHRVKNNLQLIESMLSLQSRAIDDEVALRAFGDARSRVDVLARIHEMLYQSRNLSVIDFGAYVESLAESLAMSYSLNPPYPDLVLDLAHPALDIDTAIPAGLLVNELVTNALKYGVEPGTGKRKLSIALRVEGEEAVVVVADTGPGMPPGFDPRRASSLGSQLVTSLVEQLGGTWTCVNAEPPASGARWTIRFPVDGPQS